MYLYVKRSTVRQIGTGHEKSSRLTELRMNKLGSDTEVSQVGLGLPWILLKDQNLSAK